jgi:hypothetical protein
VIVYKEDEKLQRLVSMPPSTTKTMKEMRMDCAMVLAATASALMPRGVSMEDLGVPPLDIDKKKCKGHGIRGSCIECGFGHCQFCNRFMGGKQVFWNGNCGCSDKDGRVQDHERRVYRLIERNDLISDDTTGKKADGGKKMKMAESADPVSSQTGRVKNVAARRSEPVAAEPRAKKMKNSTGAAAANQQLPIAQAVSIDALNLASGIVAEGMQAVPVDAVIALNLEPGIVVEGVESSTERIANGQWQIRLVLNVRVGFENNL